MSIDPKGSTPGLPPTNIDQESRPVNEASDVVSVSDHDVDYPEGGWAACLVVLGSFFGTVVAFGMMNTIGIFHQYLNQHQLKDYNESTIGWIFSVYVFLSFFCGIQIGPIFDLYGPRLLIISGSILLSLSMLLLCLCTHYWHFLMVFGVLGGIGTSLIFTPAMAAVSHFFLIKRGFATGISAAGGSVGGVVFPLSLQVLFPRLGFAGATRVLGGMFVGCCCIAIGLIRGREDVRKRARGKKTSVMPDLKILKEPSYALVTLGIYLMEWALFIPITYLTSFATSTGAFSPALSYQLLAILNVGSCIGRLAAGYIADKLGRFNSMIAALALCTATTLTLWLSASLLVPSNSSIPLTPTARTTIRALSITYALMFGFSSGSNISLTPVCVGQLCHTSEYGRYYATCYTIVSFGSLTGIPIAGALIGACGGRYWGVVVWTLVCYAGSAVCFVLSRTAKVGWKLGIKY